MKNIKFNDLRNGLIITLFGIILTMLTYFLQKADNKLEQLKIKQEENSVELAVKIAIVETKIDMLIESFEYADGYISHPLSISDLDGKSLDKLAQQDIIKYY